MEETHYLSCDLLTASKKLVKIKCFVTKDKSVINKNFYFDVKHIES